MPCKAYVTQPIRKMACETTGNTVNVLRCVITSEGLFLERLFMLVEVTQ